MIEISYNGHTLKIAPTFKGDTNEVVDTFMHGARKEEVMVIDSDGPVENANKHLADMVFNMTASPDEVVDDEVFVKGDKFDAGEESISPDCDLPVFGIDEPSDCHLGKIMVVDDEPLRDRIIELLNRYGK